MTDLIRDRYQLLDKLGQGGFGAVWRAFDNTLNREVAVKLLNLANENQEEMVARFKTESRVASSFEHQNILRVYDFGQDEGGRCFLVSELLKGKSLHDELKPKEALPLEVTLDVLYQVSSALEVAHLQHTVHRDIKPPNIFINEPRKGQGYIKLLDFGIAKVLGGKQESLTVTGQIMGTPHYMSPEQIVNIKLVDHRSDIYSLGIVLYQMLTGVVPFDDESYFSIMKHQMQSPMPRLDLPQYSNDLVNALQEILKLMTHKDVRKRTSDTGEILARIEQIWQAHPHSINSLNTGKFRSITAEAIAAASLTQRDKPSPEGIDRMLEPFNDADALVDQLLDSVESEPSHSEPPNSEVVQPEPTGVKVHPVAENPLERVNKSVGQEAPQQSSPQTPLDPHPSNIQTISEQPTTFSPSPMLGTKDDRKRLALIIASVAVLIIGLWQWSIRQDTPPPTLSTSSLESGVQEANAIILASAQVDTPTLKDHTRRDPLPIERLNSAVTDTPIADQGGAIALIASGEIKAESDLVNEETNNGVDVDQEINPLEVDHTTDSPSDLDKVKAQEAKAQEAKAQEAKAQEAKAQEAKAQEAKAQEAKAQEAKEREAKAQAAKRSKKKTKKKRRPKKKRKKKTKRITGKIKISPDGVSYDLGQKVRLRFPSSVAKRDGVITLGSCARWISKSSKKIVFTKTGKCTLKACYGKECIKSDVLHVVEPLF